MVLVIERLLSQLRYIMKQQLQCTRIHSLGAVRIYFYIVVVVLGLGVVSSVAAPVKTSELLVPFLEILLMPNKQKVHKLHKEFELDTKTVLLGLHPEVFHFSI